MAPSSKSKKKSKEKDSQEGLRAIVQRKINEDVFGFAHKQFSGWMVLVVDDKALRMVSSVLGMYDLMEHHITTVENLEKKRAPFKEQGVIYLVAPTEHSVDKIIGDWSSPDGKRLYGNAVFLFFLSRVSDSLVGKLKLCIPLMKRIKAFQEVNIDFLAKEPRNFHLDMPKSLPSLFPHSSKSAALDAIASKLLTVCATLNEYPHIRYQASSNLCQDLANKFHDKMNDFLRLNSNFWYYGDSNHASRDRSTLLLLDRAHDPLCPLMHEFTYQAMVNDLLDITDDKITYKTTGESNSNEPSQKDVLLNENDDVWTELKHKHIADVIQTLSNRIKDVVSSNSGAALANDQGKNLTLSEMANALKALPEYRELMSKLSQHMYISNMCMTTFNQTNLLDLSELEQTLATGQDEDGHTPKLTELIEKTVEMLPTLTPQNKLRLVSVLILSQKGLDDKNSDTLFTEANLTPDQKQTLDHFKFLGVSLTQSTQSAHAKLATAVFGKKLVQAARTDTGSEYTSARYVNNLKTVMEHMAEDRLDTEAYPGLLPLPPGKSGTVTSVRSRAAHTTSRWVKDKKKKKVFLGGRQLVFIAGGMCYSELRAAYEVMESGDKEFVLGSTSFINPEMYLEDLNSLG